MLWLISSHDLSLVASGRLPFKLVACHISNDGHLCHIFSVLANKELVKDVLTCTALTPSTYKTHHPDNTDDSEEVGDSSEDEAEGLEEILGVSHHLQKPLQPEPVPEPTPIPSSALTEEEGVIKVQRKDLKKAQGILKDILAGRKVRAASGASCDDVPFELPTVEAGDKYCNLCHQSFSLTRALRHHMKTHTGETGWVCDKCSKILSTKAMLDLHTASCGKRDKQHNYQSCNKGYTTKQALMAHLKAKHRPAPTAEELTCPTCGKVFRLIKTRREHLATHKGLFSLPKCLNRHLAEKHGFAAQKQ